MVSQNRFGSSLDDKIQAFARIGTVADDITQANNLGNLLVIDVFQHGLEGFKIAVNVTDDGALHWRQLVGNMRRWVQTDQGRQLAFTMPSLNINDRNALRE